MPYITSTRKRAITQGAKAGNVGELTYVIQQAIMSYLGGRGEMRYQHIAEVSGALHQAGRDFDERIVQPYERRKRNENGDVW